MTKRELKKLPQLHVTNAMKKIVAEDKGYYTQTYNMERIWCPNIVWFYRAKRTDDVLEVAIFTREEIASGMRTPRYRVFLHDGKYDTWEVQKERWRKATIERLEYEEYKERPRYYWYCDKGLWMNAAEKKILLDYTDNEKADPMEAVQYWQNAESNRTELDEINAQMRLVPELPKDFDDWILTDGLPQYLFYDAGRNVKIGCCTACKEQVIVDKPRYNKEIVCPNCGRTLVCKTRKKAAHIKDFARVNLLQKTPEGFVHRHFEVMAQYIDGERTGDGCWELLRVMYDKEFRRGRTYEWNRYKQTDMIRWCYQEWHGWYARNVEERSATLYWENIEEITKGTVLEHAVLKEFAKQKKFYPSNYIRTYKDGKGIEQLVKCGFYNIVGHLVSGSYIDKGYINLEETKAPKVLSLRKEYYRLLAGTDPTKREHSITYECQEVGIMPTREQVSYLAEVSAGRNFAIYARHTTLHKMIRYMHEALKDNKLQIIDYHDYLQMAAGLGYDLKDKWVLYPKNLEERHEQLIEERQEKDAELKKIEDDKKNGTLYEVIQKEHWKDYEMEDENFCLRLPQTVHEIRQEGNALHHCVATYIDRMVRGQTCILLLRAKADPLTPLYTMEVRNGYVVQCRGKYNCSMTDEVKEFVERFKKAKLNKLERKAG